MCTCACACACACGHLCVNRGNIHELWGTVVLEDRSGFLREKTLTRSRWPAKFPRQTLRQSPNKEAAQSGASGALKKPGYPGAKYLVSADEQFNEGF